jgi:hypothetical protein
VKGWDSFTSIYEAKLTEALLWSKDVGKTGQTLLRLGHDAAITDLIAWHQQVALSLARRATKRPKQAALWEEACDAVRALLSLAEDHLLRRDQQHHKLRDAANGTEKCSPP